MKNETLAKIAAIAAGLFVAGFSYFVIFVWGGNAI